MQVDRLHNDIGFLGDTPSSDDILNDKYEYPERNDTHTIHLLSQLSEIVSKWKVPRQDICITVEDYIKYWKGRKEKTSSSMLNLHVGH